ncbi:MAG: hypothetical protein H8E31_04640 [Planctomycetes bacterium]|nr:hypothetical protein [Planctomycetota bacterium]
MTTPVFRISLLPLTSLVFLFAGAAASAQSGEQTGFRLRFHGGFSPSTEFTDNTPAELSVYRAGVDVEYDLDLGEDAGLTLGAGSEFGAYDFDAFGPAPNLAGSSFPHFGHGSLYGSYLRQLDGGTGILAMARIMTGMDYKADFGDSLTFALVGGATHEVDDDLTLGFAVGVQTRLEEDVFFYPVPLIDWRIDDRWRLHTDHIAENASGFADLSGVRLSYLTSEAQECYLGVGWQLRQFRLDNDASDPMVGGAVLDSRFSVYAGTVWEVQQNLSTYLNLGFNLRQEYDIHDVNGPNPADAVSDPAPFVSFGVVFSF